LNRLASFLFALTVVGLLGLTSQAQPLVALDCSDTEDVFDCPSVKGGSYAFSIIASPSTLNPVTAEDTASLSIQDQFLGTFFTSYSILGGGPGEGNAARLIELDASGTSITATLRDGLKFSDGSPVTVDDILYWYHNVVLNPDLPNSIADVATCTDGSAFVVTSPAANQIKVSCPSGNPYRTFAGDAAYAPFVLSKQMALDLISAQNVPVSGTNQFGPLAAEEFMGLGSPLNLLRGLGPYTITSLASDSLATYAPNPNFYEVDSRGTQLPYLGQVQIVIIPTAGLNLALTNFLNGLSQVYGARPQDISVIFSRAAQGGFRVNEDINDGTPVTGETFVTPNFNDSNPNLAAAARNSTVRRALHLALDRSTMYQNVLLGIGTPQYNPVSIPTSFFNGRDNTCADFIAAKLATAATCSGTEWTSASGAVFNVRFLPKPVNAAAIQQLSCLNDFSACLAEARRLLDSVGVVGDPVRSIPANFGGFGNPGGIFEVQIVTNTGNTIREEFSKIACDGWNAIGVRCQATTTAFPTLVDQLLTGNYTGYILIGLTGGDPAGAVNVVPCGTALHLYHVQCDPSATSGPNAQTADDKALETLWLQGFRATTPDDARAAFDAYQAKFAELVPYYHLAAGNGLYAQRIDQIANTGRATNGNTNVMYRCDLAGQSPGCP
jgi:ABC-type transport system substrate-binding protein